MRVKGLVELVAKLKAKAAKVVKDASMDVVVGYSYPTAVWVHENRNPKSLGLNIPRRSGLGVYWGPSNYGPGFLLDPAREMKDELGGVVRQALKGGKTVAQALLMAGLTLQRESMKRVPVEHGDLRASAFTALEES